MNPALTQLLAVQEAGFWQAVIVFLRVGPIMGLIPGFSEQSVPMRVRLGLALAMTAITAPAIGALAPAGGVTFAHFLPLLASESAIGLMLGLGLRLFILGLQTAGSMAAQSTSLAQIFGGTAAEPLPAFGHILVIAGLALAMALGLHLRAAEFVIRSYDWLPAGTWPDPLSVAQWGVDRVAGVFSLAFRLAMPFLVVSVIYNLTLGVINRAMPLLMVAFVGAPAITAGGLILLALLAPVMITIWFEAMAQFLADPLGPAR